MTRVARLAVSIAIGALVACGSEGSPAAPEAREEGAASSPAEGTGPAGATGSSEPAPGSGSGSGTGTASVPEEPAPAPADACARARGCCPAYVAALPNAGERGTAEQACASLEVAIEAGGPAADEACQGALDGFRRSLEATGRETPAECR